MENNQLVILSKRFAVDIVNICTETKDTKRVNDLINQMLRSK